MKERPILFSAPMVRAILDGSKTQTRRVVTPAPMMVTDRATAPWEGPADALLRLLELTGRHCPYGQPGDSLWVREAWSLEMIGAFGTAQGYDSTYELRFRADDTEREIHVAPGEPDPYIKLYDSQRGDWRPSIHMPRWASRILLEIVSVRVERLNDISASDAKQEGLKRIEYKGESFGFDGGNPTGYGSATGAFRALWESINGTGSWDANPWVWVVEFKRVMP